VIKRLNFIWSIKKHLPNKTQFVHEHERYIGFTDEYFYVVKPSYKFFGTKNPQTVDSKELKKYSIARVFLISNIVMNHYGGDTITIIFNNKPNKHKSLENVRRYDYTFKNSYVAKQFFNDFCNKQKEIEREIQKEIERERKKQQWREKTGLTNIQEQNNENNINNY
jgi:hypothetical protein